MPSLLKSLFRSRPASADATATVFPSYEAAARACGGDGYSTRSLVDMVVAKNVRARRGVIDTGLLPLDQMRLAIAIAAVSGAPLRVLDFGGGGGFQHVVAQRILGDARDLRWHVVETTAMANQAAAAIDAPGLRFFDTCEAAADALGAVDLVIISSSLQYMPNPLATLDRLIGLQARHLFLTRTPFVDGPETIFSVQTSRLAHNGPGPLPPGFEDGPVQYPITFTPHDAVVAALRRGYDIRFTLDEGPFKHGALDRPLIMRGYFCDRTVPPASTAA